MVRPYLPRQTTPERKGRQRRHRIHGRLPSTKAGRFSLTQGLGTIMDARLWCWSPRASAGPAAVAVAVAVEGPVTSLCPGSILQFHPHTTVVVDESAASRLMLLDYYRHTYAHKPGWQRPDRQFRTVGQLTNACSVPDASTTESGAGRESTARSKWRSPSQSTKTLWSISLKAASPACICA